MVLKLWDPVNHYAQNPHPWHIGVLGRPSLPVMLQMRKAFEEAEKNARTIPLMRLIPLLRRDKVVRPINQELSRGGPAPRISRPHAGDMPQGMPLIQSVGRSGFWSCKVQISVCSHRVRRQCLAPWNLLAREVAEPCRSSRKQGLSSLLCRHTGCLCKRPFAAGQGGDQREAGYGQLGPGGS